MMYEELVKRLREAAEYVPCIMKREDAINAADAIEELSLKYIEERNAAVELTGELASKPRWIPVTERLPLYGQDVLAVRTYGDGEKCQEVLMAHIAVSNEETGEKWWNATNITHWMPLPEPPQEEL